jgi:4-amino-4-deoxy-L-arabinose transferase-like glycosyltransferase
VTSFRDFARVADRRADGYAPRIAAAMLLIAGVVLLSLVLREPLARLGPDGAHYEALGWQAAQTPGIFDCGNLGHAFWAPGWVATIAALYKVTGRDPNAIRVLLVAIALLTAALVYAITSRVAGRRAALAALAFFLLARFTFLYTTYAQYEIAQAMTVVAAAALLFLPCRRRWAFDLAAGVVLAASALLSGRALVLLPLAALALARDGGWRRGAARTLVVVLGAALVLVPWAVRNYRCEGTWILATTNGGYNLWLGNNAHSTGGYYEASPEDRPPYPYYASAEWTREALGYMAAHPAQTVVRSAIKAMRFWVPLYADQFVLFAAAVVGLFRLRRRGSDESTAGLWLWILGVPLALMLVQSLFFVQARFFVMAQPCVAILAGVGVAGWRNGTGRDGAGRDVEAAAAELLS